MPKTELEQACVKGNLSKVKTLMEHGSPSSGKNVAGSKLFTLAVMSGQIELVQYLLERGAKINEKDSASDLCPIHFAIFDGIAMTRYLIDHGADVNAPAGAFGASLNIAVHQDDLATARYLLERHAGTETREVVTVCDNGKIIARNKITPLIDAAAGGSLQMTQLLVKYKANVNAVDENGAVWDAKNQYPPGPLTSSPGTALAVGDTALDAAIKQGHKDVAEYLQPLSCRQRPIRR